MDNEDIDIRNGCASDEECLKHGRTLCDTDPNCYGIAWLKTLLTQPLKICRSRKMEIKTDGWRTMMKQGCYILSLYHNFMVILRLVSQFI